VILETSTSIQYKTVIVWPGWDVFTEVTTGKLGREMEVGTRISPAISMRSARDRPTRGSPVLSLNCEVSGSMTLANCSSPFSVHLTLLTEADAYRFQINAAPRLCDLMLRLRAAPGSLAFHGLHSHIRRNFKSVDNPQK
jgi:hypothetical protein